MLMMRRISSDRVNPAKLSADYLQTLALVRTAQGKPQAAMVLLSQALKLRPKSFDLLYESAGLAAQQNRWDEMIGFLRRATKCNQIVPKCCRS